MKKIKYFIFIFVMLLFMPLTVCKAADIYVASVIKSNGTVTKIGDYTDYAEAKNASIDYDSDASSVSVVYRNDKIVYLLMILGFYDAFRKVKNKLIKVD